MRRRRRRRRHLRRKYRMSHLNLSTRNTHSMVAHTHSCGRIQMSTQSLCLCEREVFLARTGIYYYYYYYYHWATPTYIQLEYRKPSANRPPSIAADRVLHIGWEFYQLIL